MDKRALGKARVASLETLLKGLLGQEDTTLRQALNDDLVKKDGTFHLGRLAESIGLDCVQATFRQNKACGSGSMPPRQSFVHAESFRSL